jgi:hypothetical protein
MPWALYTACSGCGEMRHCRGKTRDRMVCLACFVVADNNAKRQRPRTKRQGVPAA